MNYRLPILSVALGLAISLAMASACAAQVNTKQEVTDNRPEPVVGRAAQGTAPANFAQNGQQLVAQAAQQLLVAPGLEAKTRQSVHLFGQKLIGSGSYCQLTRGPKLFLKLELKLQVADHVRSLRQISDGDLLWEVRGTGETQSYTYVNLGRLREVASETKPLVPPSLWMALGGLPRLLSELEHNFEFQAAEPLTIGEHPVWSVEGQWKPEVLARLLPDQKEVILSGGKPHWNQLPPQVPHGITLVLGRDRVIPLFPYSFSFYRKEVLDDETGETQKTPVLTWDLFEVRIRTELMPSDFAYQPSRNEHTKEERTDEYIARLKAEAERMIPHSARR